MNHLAKKKRQQIHTLQIRSEKNTGSIKKQNVGMTKKKVILLPPSRCAAAD